MSFGNMVVKSKSTEDVINCLKRDLQAAYEETGGVNPDSMKPAPDPGLPSYYVTEPIGDEYVCVFPANEMIVDQRAHVMIAKFLSTVVAGGSVYDSDTVRIFVYEDESVNPDPGLFSFNWQEEEPEIMGSIEKVYEKFKPGEYNKDFIKELSKQETYAEDVYRKFLEEFNLPIILGHWGHHYIAKEAEDSDLKDVETLFGGVKIHEVFID